MLAAPRLIVMLVVLCATCVLVLLLMAAGTAPYWDVMPSVGGRLFESDPPPYEYTSPYFLYLIMARGGRPEYLDAVLKTNRSRLVTLSWEENAPTTDVFMPESTITTGRIRLGEFARHLEQETGHRYMYWIWMDEDAVFGPEPVQESIRNWEDFLLEWQPAVGVSDYNPRLPGVIEAMNAGGNADVWSVFSFDGIFNAQHHETLAHMTPLNATYDDESWHMSALINLYKAGAYVDHVLEFRGLKVRNPEHRSPVDYLKSSEVFRRVEPFLPGDHLPRPLAECVEASGRHHFDLTLMMWGTPRRKYWSYDAPMSPATWARRRRSWALHNRTACVLSMRALEDTTPFYVHPIPDPE
ncbi:Glycosyl transferase 64 domain-containing protein [Plasmodiophora brassicae]|uniref:Uncharacterized protein n=1 Tax=Plasmodiophora brassicae TaxID=37360 RepID=A0A0G4IW93_PLABS|nr:hypothetical protein PBRA_007308 [Plasmodiophora brassicae]